MLEDRLMRVLFRRNDGTYVIELDGLPYHVTLDDAFFPEVAAAAKITPPGVEPAPAVPAWATNLPNANRAVSALKFLERFTKAERIALRRAARINDNLGDWLEMLRAAQEVDLDDPRTVSGIQVFADAGLIDPSRVQEILADATPA